MTIEHLATHRWRRALMAVSRQESAFERSPVCRCSVRREQDLDRQREQRPLDYVGDGRL